MTDHRADSFLSRNVETRDGGSRPRARFSEPKIPGAGNGEGQGTSPENHGVGGSSPSLRTIQEVVGEAITSALKRELRARRHA